jgi:hypothetical protein
MRTSIQKAVVTYLNTVRSQEQNALEILQLPQEDAHERIAVYLMHVPLLEENIRLV